MFSKENQSWLYDEPAAKPIPVVQAIQSVEPPFAAPVAKRRGWLLAVPFVLVGIVGGIAVAGFQSQERPEIVMPEMAKQEPVSVATKQEISCSPVATKSDCTCGDGCKCVGVCACDKKVVVAKSAPLPIVPVSVPAIKEDPKPQFVSLPKPEPKPEVRPVKIGIEEKSDKNTEKKLVIYDELLKANEAGKEADKPILLWANGILDDEKNRAIQEDIGERAVHLKGTGKDATGPYVKLLSSDDNTWFIKASKFNDKTSSRIKEVLPTRNYANIKFPQAEPKLTVRNRNTPDGMCLTCSIDTLIKHNGFEVDLMKDASNPLRNDRNKKPWVAWKVIHDKGIPAQWTRPGFSDFGYLRKACEEGIGCTVGINMNHEINLVGVDAKSVAIIDNNDPALRTRIVSRQAFSRVWDGTSIVVFPKGKEHVLRSWGQCGPNGCVPSRELDGNAQFMPGETGRFAQSEGSYPRRIPSGPAPMDFSCTMSRATLMIHPMPPSPSESMYQAKPTVAKSDVAAFWIEAGYTADEAKSISEKSESGTWK